ncbi:MAG: hypothetical protein HGA76_11085 [Candidatus Firestonebacteria bacterium]|nr:hypothetical protein [Candidatus Firestonebacteria bacterium]
MLLRYGLELWNILVNLAPWLLAGAAISALLKLLLPADFIHHHIGRAGLGSILKAVIFGLPLPLCSCGVVPTAMGLRRDGASPGATVGFLITTPETGADSLMVTAGFLGWPLALFRVGAAVIMGVTGGWLTDRLHTVSPVPTAAADGGACALPAQASWLSRFWNYALEDLLRTIYRYLTLGVLLAAAISTLIPRDFVANLPILQGLGGMLLMLVIASPLYVCSTGSVAIAAALVQTGLPWGSALVFLMSGVATNVATVAAILKAFGKKILALYLTVVIAGSIGAGLLFDVLFVSGGANATHFMAHHHETATFWNTWLAPGAAVFLLAFMLKWGIADARLALRGWWASRRTAPETLLFSVGGMTCNNCVNHVKRDLLATAGVRRVEVNLVDGSVVVHGTHLERAVLARVIQNAGYSVRETAQ